VAALAARQSAIGWNAVLMADPIRRYYQIRRQWYNWRRS